MGPLNHDHPLRFPENRRILDLPHGIETKTPGRRCATSTPLTPRACRPPSAGTASAFLRIDAGTCLDPWLRGLPAADG
ncbi:MAG TPA: hypothetical protein PKD87_13185 [Burkholderiaceae bacterium]|nr:hypothetical protein [Burkholderiaceae bacterium]